MEIGFNETHANEFLQRFKNSDNVILFKNPKENDRIGWNLLVKRGLIEHIGNYEFTITSKGKKVLRLGSWNQYLKYEELKENRNTRKEYYDFLLSKYRYKTFWIVFLLGLFGGLYSIYDIFIKSQDTEKKLNQINIDTQENTKAIEGVYIEILNQKNLDSLRIPNPEQDNIKN
ncbi:hypothetical protein ACPX19_01385 [Winogradskyella sp. HB-48]|uniref:hypothetical protein n=1 Tax=Winogradskyella sp. HB-48 TaxID=3416808 RepID=UPI003CF5AE13